MTPIFTSPGPITPSHPLASLHTFALSLALARQHILFPACLHIHTDLCVCTRALALPTHVGKGPIQAAECHHTSVKGPGIPQSFRQPAHNEYWSKPISAVVPIGRGQCELIVGDCWL